MLACQKGQKQVVQLLLNLAERIELNATNNYGWIALMYACEDGHKDVVQLPNQTQELT